MEPSYALQWDYVKELSRAMDGLQTYCGRLDTPTVVFGGEKVYRKQLQPYYPDQSSPGQYRRNDTIDSVSEEKRTTRGWKRWTALPNPVETHSEWLPVHEEVQVSRPSTTASSNFRELQQSREGRVKWRCGHELLNMFEEWRLKWGITDQFGDAGQDQVVQHLRHPADGVRLSALYHCARAAMTIFIAAGKSVKKEGQSVDKECEMFSTLRIFVPDLEKCLRDVNMCMRVGAAVLLTTLGQWSQQLEKLLLNTLPTPQVSEQWMALQCLAVQGVVRPEVVDCLLSHANQSQSPSRRDKARELLARLSKTTTLVYATVCEQLNSSGWQERLTACTVLPMLSGSVTKDVCDKLIVLMWQDWSSEVRHMAAEALGKLGRGKLIHDELCRRLAIEDERIRLDALRKVGALSLMTAQMLPAFLTCFQDPHISVRIEASSVAAEMGLSSKEVLDVLLFLTEDPSIKVKAHALRCLGVLGNSRSDIIDRLLWCMRFDRSETLRAEACEAVRILGVQSDRVVQELQMLVSHDDSELVVRLAKHALLSLGCQPKAYNKMETKIAEDIKNLTTLENVLHAC
jgi:HEAT repeat protein